MVIYVFGVAVVNFLLGYALAVYRERQGALAPVAPPAERASKAASKTPPVAPVPEDEPPPDESEGFDPYALAAEADRAESGADAEEPETADDSGSTQESVFQAVFDLDTETLRTHLLQVNRCVADNAPLEQMSGALTQLTDDARRWIAEANAASQRLEKDRDGLGELQEPAQRIDELLAAVLFRAETAVQSLAEAQEEAFGAVGDELLGELAELLEDLHIFLDQRCEVQLDVLRHAGALDALPQERLVDPRTRLHNRLGLERVYRQWRQEHSEHAPWSVAVLDIDGFGQVNGRWGAAVGDRLLAAFGGLVDDLLRKDRGFDRAARHGADQFVLFLGDTDADNAVNAAERIRQTIEASSFALDDEQIDLTVSIGVATADADAAFDDVLRQATEASQAARDDGGNRTGRHTGQSPEIELARPYQVKGRIVKLAPP